MQPGASTFADEAPCSKLLRAVGTSESTKKCEGVHISRSCFLFLLAFSEGGDLPCAAVQMSDRTSLTCRLRSESFMNEGRRFALDTSFEKANDDFPLKKVCPPRSQFSDSRQRRIGSPGQRHFQRRDSGVDCASDNGGIPLGMMRQIPHPRSRSNLWRGHHTPIACHGHPTQARGTSFTLAKWLCRTASDGPHHCLGRDCLGRGASAPNPEILC